MDGQPGDDHPRKVGVMGQVLIKCPTTGKPLATGMAMPKAAFQASSFQNNTVGPCPHCGRSHTWSKANAWVEGD